MKKDPHIGNWIWFSSILFGALGFISLLITDMVLLPHAPGSSTGLYFSKSPVLVASTAIMPALFAFIASHRWLRKGSRLFGGWLSVAVFSWVSLVLNPAIWLLVLSSFMLYGFLVLGLLLVGGVILQLSWSRVCGATHA
jgi:hypothetical protein